MDHHQVMLLDHRLMVEVAVVLVKVVVQVTPIEQLVVQDNHSLTSPHPYLHLLFLLQLDLIGLH